MLKPLGQAPNIGGFLNHGMARSLDCKNCWSPDPDMAVGWPDGYLSGDETTLRFCLFEGLTGASRVLIPSGTWKSGSSRENRCVHPQRVGEWDDNEPNELLSRENLTGWVISALLPVLFLSNLFESWQSWSTRTMVDEYGMMETQPHDRDQPVLGKVTIRPRGPLWTCFRWFLCFSFWVKDGASAR